MANILFSRDPAAVINNGVVFGKMLCRDRVKEPACIRAIFRYHSLFRDTGFRTWYGVDAEDETPVEGGNLHCYSRNVLLIGMNERTHPASIEKIARRTMSNEEVTDVLVLMFENPRLNSTDSIGLTVHADMFLNMIDRDAFLFFPYIEKKLVVFHITRGRAGSLRIKRENSIFEAIKKALGLSAIRVINVGGDKSEAVSLAEQRAGAGGNTVNLEPGKVCIWDPTVETIRALEKNGIEVVAVQADELVKGGGGPRCSTMPLWRDVC